LTTLVCSDFFYLWPVNCKLHNNPSAGSVQSVVSGEGLGGQNNEKHTEAGIINLPKIFE